MNTSNIPNNNIKSTPNKQKIRLLFPYSENQKLKKLGVKWDVDNKYWYYPSIDGTLPENLKMYKCYAIAIEYDNKEFYKPILPSMRFDKLQKLWLVNEEDYNKYISY